MGNLKRVLIKNLGVSRSCLMQLKAPDRSVDIAPPSSFFFGHGLIASFLPGKAAHFKYRNPFESRINISRTYFQKKKSHKFGHIAIFDILLKYLRKY